MCCSGDGGRKSLLCDPGPESRLAREGEKENENAKIIDGMSTEKKLTKIKGTGACNDVDVEVYRFLAKFFSG